MNRLLTILARTLSVIAHPLWMPTYGILIFCAAFSSLRTPLPVAYWLIAVFGTLVLTAIIPLSVMLLQLFRGTITSLEMRNAQERTPVYIYSIICYFFWVYFVGHVLRAPVVLPIIAIGATLALVGVMLINKYWKISAHLTGIGGLIGGICAYCFYAAVFPPVWLISGLLVVALLLMYARIYLRSHTPQQVVAGLLSGLTITMLPALIYCLIISYV